MSSEAVAWAFKLDVKPSSVKFTLVALCECANFKTGRITPSIAHLCEITGQDRKTVIANVAELERRGIIQDTGERCGATKQIKVYRAATGTDAPTHKPECHYVYRLTDPETGEFYIGVRSFLGDPAKDSYRGSGRWPTGAAYRGIKLHREIVAVFQTRSEAERAEANMIAEAISLPLCCNINEESHKRDTIPKMGPLNSSENGRKESQKRDTEPSLEPSTPVSSNEDTSPDRVSVDEVLEGWNEIAAVHGLAQVRKLTDQRRRKVQAQAKRFSVPDWQAVFARISQSPFLKGDNRQGWRCDFDFILSENNFVKILEGKYDRQPPDSRR